MPPSKLKSKSGVDSAPKRKRAARPVNIALDSYSNPAARIGVGTANLVNSGDYPLTRITRNYMLMLSLYRSSWVVRKVVDVLAEDMLKQFPTVSSEVTPEQISQLDRVVRKTGTLGQLLRALKWGRLFGGGIALPIIAGQKDLSEPLDVDTIDVGSYRGLIVLDRWSGVMPGPILVSDFESPVDFGLPDSYICTMDAKVVTVHHSRVLRFTGRELPEWERQSEMYWGLSEVELIFDELKKFDYVGWNIVSLMTRAQIMSIVDPQLSSAMSGATMNADAYAQYVARMAAISSTMNNQGLMILGKDGSLESKQYSFGGVADVYNTFLRNVSAACEIPLKRLVGSEGGGLSQTNEGELQTYYDTVEQKRNREVSPQLDKLFPIIAMSSLGFIPDDLDYSYPPVRTMSNEDRAKLAKETTDAIVAAYDADLITKQVACKELKQASDANGLFSNITDEDIASTPDEYASDLGGAGEFGEALGMPGKQPAGAAA